MAEFVMCNPLSLRNGIESASTRTPQAPHGLLSAPPSRPSSGSSSYFTCNSRFISSSTTPIPKPEHRVLNGHPLAPSALIGKTIIGHYDCAYISPSATRKQDSILLFFSDLTAFHIVTPHHFILDLSPSLDDVLSEISPFGPRAEGMVVSHCAVEEIDVLRRRALTMRLTCPLLPMLRATASGTRTKPVLGIDEIGPEADEFWSPPLIVEVDYKHGLERAWMEREAMEKCLGMKLSAEFDETNLSCWHCLPRR
ncbi:hypothetical protein BT69DRAFT_1315524 [Atractiella rhizophila]|nr:hypothetical protein BT69DRAFT_1315524 [Atractiella rhizophila]